MEAQHDAAPAEVAGKQKVGEGPGEEFILVTAPGCGYCEHARAVLAELGVPVREVDAEDEETAALAAHGVVAFLPVLTDGERVIAYGRFSSKRLRRELGL